MAAIELLAAIVLWGIASTGVIAALLTTARAARAVALRAERRDMLRAAAALSAFELRNSAGDPAALRVSAQQIEYRTRRWNAATCAWPTLAGGRLELPLRAPALGERSPLAFRDSALVWIEGYPSEGADGQWRALAVTGLRPRPCPNGSAGLVIELEPWPPGEASSRVQPGAPVIGYERAALRIYRGGDGEHWLGQATARPGGWNAVQPIAGPVASSSGFTLRADGRSVSVTLKASDGAADSVHAIVALRAAPPVPP